MSIAFANQALFRAWQPPHGPEPPYRQFQIIFVRFRAMPKAGSHPIFKLLETAQLPELGPGPRAGVRSEREVRELAAKALHDTTGARSDLVTALVLLWHDHLDAAHTIAQDVANSDGAFIHGIMHRRETDYSNAAYWFRRVGDHTAFPALAEQVKELPGTSASSQLLARLEPSGKWNPFAFIEACSEATNACDSALINTLQQIQRLETEVLLQHLLD